jgi:hypothetical protein
MVVEIKEDIFKSNNFKELNYLIQILTHKQRYALFVEWTLIKDTALYNKLDADDQKEIEENYNRIATEELMPTHFVSFTSADNQFNLEEAIRFFIQPVSIILENSLNDQYFVMAIIKHFDASEEVIKHFNNGWIQFENAGGCTNIPNFIDAKLQSFNNLAAKYSKSKNDYLRCFVIMDSDKCYLGMSLKPDKQKVETYLDEVGVKKHILEKREMENYIPDSILAGFNDVYLNLYLKLTRVQKDYFDLEKGFNKNRSDKNFDANIRALYRSITDTDWKTLKNGIKCPPYDKQFKSEFPKLFEDKNINKMNLSTRTGSNELQDILNKITSLL